jgi:uncharacterized protein YyaL (SSP411 family)
MSHDHPNRPPNRLAGENSPYLLQHQFNPVDWHPWGEEAFARARAENKPLLISIGYSACHWCHVMEHESFSNEEIARVINETVIPVKVDREERPDVDAIYMNACQAMTGQGGWPLNAFVTPDLKPFFVGTYFPPQDNYGRPGFVTVLEKIREAWALDGRGLVAQAEQLHQQLEQFGKPSDSQALAPDLLDDVVRDSASMYDLRHGGFGTAPKFPPDTRLALLLAAHTKSGDESALRMVTGTLDAMAYGGMYDQVGGGFARYSVDAQWLIPHFEKMLYNQALLIPVYADAFLVTKNYRYKRIARESVDWVLRELTSKEGVFQCAYDADSEGEEGKFYVWTPAQVKEILGDTEDARVLCEFYGITERGNFEHGTSNPHVPVPPEEFAAARQMTKDQWMDRFRPMRQALRDARAKRVWPGLDDKCLTGWNGLMISALCRAAQAFDEERFEAAATQAAAVLLNRQWKGEVLLRVLKGDHSSVRGTLEDYAFFADGLIDLYETTFDSSWAEAARSIAAQMLKLFLDPASGGFFYTDGADPSLISRTRDNHDGALPAAGSVAAKALLRLGTLFRDKKLTDAGRRAIASDGRRANSHPLAYASLVIAGFYTQPELAEITLTGSNLEQTRKLAKGVWQTYLPARVIAAHTSDGRPLPLAAEKPGGGSPQAWVCHSMTCLPPVSTPEELGTIL